MSDERDPAPLSRRGFLALMAPAALLLSGLPPSRAMAGIPERGLVIHHQHTGEWLRTVYFADGRYIPSSLRDIDRVLRDWRTDQITVIDPRVLDIVTFLQRKLHLADPLEVVCGYRSAATNAMLRRRSRGVAKNSLHIRGQAIDISFPAPALAAVHRAALELGAGGVGYYPAAGFIHLDSGTPRQWQQLGGRRSRRGRAGRLPLLDMEPDA
jgi:uncharacterized protein YcbK (DUF882 family)